jgi:uncharacterized damage-inducible protein DinB
MFVGHALDDLAAHHIWATAELLTFCQGLDAAALEATTPGVYGTAIGTLRHLLDSEASYFFRLTGAWSARPWPEGEPVGLDVLRERAATLATALTDYLAGDTIDTERLGEAWGDDGDVFDVRAGIFLTQIIHHANEHRAHVCSILGAHGHEPPELSAWAYALATGRMTLRERRPT